MEWLLSEVTSLPGWSAISAGRAAHRHFFSRQDNGSRFRISHFWPWKNGLLSVYPPVRCDIQCDVVVLKPGLPGSADVQALAEEIGCRRRGASAMSAVAAQGARHGSASIRDRRAARRTSRNVLERRTLNSRTNSVTKSIDDIDQLIARLRNCRAAFRHRNDSPSRLKFTVKFGRKATGAVSTSRGLKGRASRWKYSECRICSAHFPASASGGSPGVEASGGTRLLHAQLISSTTAPPRQAGRGSSIETTVEKHGPCDSCRAIERRDRDFGSRLRMPCSLQDMSR